MQGALCEVGAEYIHMYPAPTSQKTNIYKEIPVSKVSRHICNICRGVKIVYHKPRLSI